MFLKFYIFHEMLPFIFQSKVLKHVDSIIWLTQYFQGGVWFVASLYMYPVVSILNDLSHYIIWL